jgi:hypothetical protein
MGLKDGAKTLHSVTGLTIEHVFKMCKGLTDEYHMDTPTIDVDCSNVCFKVGKTVPSVASILIKWANAGFLVVPVCDAKVRPVSKQATNKRKADRDKNRIKAAIIHKELRSHRSRVYTDAVNPITRTCQSAKRNPRQSAKNTSNAIATVAQSTIMQRMKMGIYYLLTSSSTKC